MKSVLFIMNYRVDNSSRRKYDDQMNAVRRLGYDVWHIGNDDKSFFLCHGDNKKIHIGDMQKLPSIIPHENVLYMSMYKCIDAVLKIKKDFAYAYLRRFFFEGRMCSALKKLHNNGVKTIIEIPTYPHLTEMGADKDIKHRLLAWYNNRYEKKSAKHIDLFCPMGEHVDSILGRPALNIQNGIDVTNIKLRTPKFVEGEYHILALAVMAFWHGYDRLINSLAEYKSKGGKEKVYIHMVGEGAALPEWERLAKEKNLTDCVLFEGKKNNDELNAAVDGYDLGAASLGRYRSGLSVVYELKTREYMARGLPFIYATDDYVIHAFGKYCIRIPNDDTPIEMNELISFMDEMRSDNAIPARMRQYAVDEMSFDKQFLSVFNYLESK